MREVTRERSAVRAMQIDCFFLTFTSAHHLHCLQQLGDVRLAKIQLAQRRICLHGWKDGLLRTRCADFVAEAYQLAQTRAACNGSKEETHGCVAQAAVGDVQLLKQRPRTKSPARPAQRRQQLAQDRLECYRAY